jgi:hypothetical protein
MSTVPVVGSHNAAAAMAQQFERIRGSGIGWLECAFPAGEPEKVLLSASMDILFRFSGE